MADANPLHEYREMRREKIAQRRVAKEHSPAIERLIASVATQFNVRVEHVRSGGRMKPNPVVAAREMIVMTLIRAGYSTPQIGRQLGYLDHSAVVRMSHRVRDVFLPDELDRWWNEAKAETASA